MFTKVVLVANCIDLIPVFNDCDYIGIDGGALTCMRQNIPIVCAVGDFDSVSDDDYEQLSKYTKIIKLPREKDDVDSEHALRYALSLGYKELILYGVTGKRMDHFLVIYSLMKYANFDFSVVDEYNRIYPLNPGHHIIKKRSKYISVFPCEKQTITYKGMKYPLDHRVIEENNFYLTSNEILEDEAEITTDGRLIVIEAQDK